MAKFKANQGYRLFLKRKEGDLVNIDIVGIDHGSAPKMLVTLREQIS